MAGQVVDVTAEPASPVGPAEVFFPGGIPPIVAADSAAKVAGVRAVRTAGLSPSTGPGFAA